ncbi:hypothetical protein FS749_006421, partial [Ceratobasidium sp. UAMH 11750]
SALYQLNPRGILRHPAPPAPDLQQPHFPSSPSPALELTEKKKMSILLIGETGTGKTSFMSLLANLFQGIGPSELEDWHDQSKESGLGKTYSQTTKATLYSFSTCDGTRIEILDTPGLADTRGIERDDIHKAEINRAIQELVTSIDAVMIITNGTLERLTAPTDYTLNIISSMFPRSIIDNIGFIFTHADPLSFNFQFESIQPELRGARYWLLQNPLAMKKNYSRIKGSLQKNQAKRMEDQINACYDDTIEMLNGWLRWIDQRQVQPTKEIDRLYHISIDIESSIEETVALLIRLSEERVMLTNASSGLLNAEDVGLLVAVSHRHVLIKPTRQLVQALQYLKEKETAPVWSRVLTEKTNTICLAQGCFSNCHTRCDMRMTYNPKTLGRWCRVFKHYRMVPSFNGASSKCNVCGHTAEQHRHYPQLHVKKSPLANPEIQQWLEDARSKEKEYGARRLSFQRKLDEVKEQMSKARDRVRSLVEDHNNVSLNKNFAGHVHCAIQMLKLRREDLKGKPDAADELQLLDESIAKYEQKLLILAEQSEKDEKAKIVIRGARGAVRGVST